GPTAGAPADDRIKATPAPRTVMTGVAAAIRDIAGQHAEGLLTDEKYNEHKKVLLETSAGHPRLGEQVARDAGLSARRDAVRKGDTDLNHTGHIRNKKVGVEHFSNAISNVISHSRIMCPKVSRCRSGGCDERCVGSSVLHSIAFPVSDVTQGAQFDLESGLSHTPPATLCLSNTLVFG